MQKLPDAIFVADPKKEKIAVAEAIKLSIPIVAIVDTNCNPEEINYVIPGNDDAIRAVKLISSVIADDTKYQFKRSKEIRMNISAQMVKKLRTKTSAGMMDCKKALKATEGDIEKAIEYLRKKGMDAASSKLNRKALNGMVGSYIHLYGKIGVPQTLNLLPEKKFPTV